MKRRDLLRAGAFAVLTGTAGCLSREDEVEGNGADDHTDDRDGEESEEEEEEEIPTVGSDEGANRHRDLLRRIDQAESPDRRSLAMAEFEEQGMRAVGYEPATYDTATAAILYENHEDGNDEDSSNIDDEDTGAPVLRTAVVAGEDETAELSVRNVVPYDGVGENEEGDRLYAVPTENHDLAEHGDVPATEWDGTTGLWTIENEGDHRPDEWLPETVRIEAGKGYVGEYALVPEEELREGTYEFDGELFVQVWDVRSPGPEEESQFAGISVPNLRFDFGVRSYSDLDTSWYHEADEGTEAYVQPSVESVELPATVRFDIVNMSRDSLGDRDVRGDGDWSVHKLVERNGESVWVHVDGVASSRNRFVAPGTTDNETLHLFHGEPEDRNGDGDRDRDGNSDSNGDEDNERDTAGYLGGGRYAVDFGYSNEDGERLAAMFDVDAPSLVVEPPEDAETELEDGRVVVTTDGYRDAEEDERASFELERIGGFDMLDDEERDDIVVPERLFDRDGTVTRDEELRYALPFFEEGIDEVVVETDETTVGDLILRGSSERRFVYEDEPYVLRT